jgi:N6-adenosine-specific RNA methylase IME4
MNETFSAIVADPPWPQARSGPRSKEKRGGPREWKAGTRASLPYETMTVEQIAALPVEPVAAEDAHLYLWTTNRYIEDAFAVARAWGFQYSTMLPWCKSPMGLGPGGAYAITAEFCLFCRRGSLAPLRRWDTSWFNFKRVKANGSVKHSAKPEPFFDVVEQVSPGPYLELFARRERLGWKTWGDQSANSAELELRIEAA